MADNSLSRFSGSFSGEGLRCERGERVVFDALDFTLAAGDALILVGPNGSGKSSLLRLMAGLLPPAAGAIRRDGVDIADDPDGHRGALHYVGHLDAVKAVLTVAENLDFWAGVRGGSSVGRALETFGLSSLADAPARLLSAGQRRRLNLARLAASPASLWLLDEPTVALDTASVASVAALIAEHRAAGGMVVASTHTGLDVGGAARLALDDFAAAPDYGDAADELAEDGF